IGASGTGLALFAIIWSVDPGSLTLIYAAYALLGLGWGGMIPLQEVIWGAYFGRRYLGAVRSAAVPFALLLGAGAPLAVSYYNDQTGTYTGALLVVAALNVLSGLFVQLTPPPRSVEVEVATAA
ncbi:MAG: hypothetical protein ACC642_10255, partial [Pseudomonadales bacterium]